MTVWVFEKSFFFSQKSRISDIFKFFCVSNGKPGKKHTDKRGAGESAHAMNNNIKSGFTISGIVKLSALMAT
jgi:hypothetical protein